MLLQELWLGPVGGVCLGHNLARSGLAIQMTKVHMFGEIPVFFVLQIPIVQPRMMGGFVGKYPALFGQWPISKMSADMYLIVIVSSGLISQFRIMHNRQTAKMAIKGIGGFTGASIGVTAKLLLIEMI